MIKRIGIVMFLSAGFLFLGASCTFGSSGAAVFKSESNGNQWRPISIMTEGKRKIRLSSIDVTRLVIDPRNSNLLLMGTLANGLFVSDSGGENWVQLIGKETIVDVLPDPTAHCTMYVVTRSQLLKTANCAEKWDIIYNESRSSTILSGVAVDQYQPSTLFLASSAGDVFRSLDGGATWATIYRLENNSIARIMIDPFDSSHVYFATDDGKIYRSTNHGDSFSLASDLAEREERRVQMVAMSSLSRQDGIFYASRDSLFISRNGGQAWERIVTLTPSQTTYIVSAAVNPINEREIYYLTPNTLYFSDDSGAHWRVTPLPGQRPSGAFVIDPNNPRIVYMGERTYRSNASSMYTKYLK